MYTLIRLPDGNMLEAVVLANTRYRMRLAVPGLHDTVELRLSGTQWLDEHSLPVQFGFLLAQGGADIAAPKLAHAASG